MQDQLLIAVILKPVEIIGLVLYLG